MKTMRDAREHDHRRTCLPIRGGSALLAAALLLFTPKGKTQVINAGFEASTPDQSWQVEPEEAKQSYTITADKKDFKGGAPVASDICRKACDSYPPSAVVSTRRDSMAADRLGQDQCVGSASRRGCNG